MTIGIRFTDCNITCTVEAAVLGNPAAFTAELQAQYSSVLRALDKPDAQPADWVLESAFGEQLDELGDDFDPTAEGVIEAFALMNPLAEAGHPPVMLLKAWISAFTTLPESAPHLLERLRGTYDCEDEFVASQLEEAGVDINAWYGNLIELNGAWDKLGFSQDYAFSGLYVFRR
jgi:hypothetical protein